MIERDGTVYYAEIRETASRFIYAILPNRGVNYHKSSIRVNINRNTCSTGKNIHDVRKYVSESIICDKPKTIDQVIFYGESLIMHKFDSARLFEYNERAYKTYIYTDIFLNEGRTITIMEHIDRYLDMINGN